MKGYKARINEILIQEKQYKDPEFSASKLAERLGVSVFRLSRILKAEYGMTYTAIVHEQRMQDAMRHLKDPRYAPFTVDDIGTMVGFRNQQSFFEAFRRATGTTPMQYRKRGQTGNATTSELATP